MNHSYPQPIDSNEQVAAGIKQGIAERERKFGTPKPRQRSSEQIKADIFALVGEKSTSVEGDEGVVKMWERRLAEESAHLEDVNQAIERTEGTIAKLRAAGVAENHSRMQEFLGYSFKSKTTEQNVFVNGILQNLQEERDRTAKEVSVLTDAVSRTKARVAVELPKLRAELAEAIERESLL